MTFFRRSGWQIVLLVLALVGVGISLYLTVSHDANIPVAYSSSGVMNCELVLSSAYSTVPGTSIPISIPGMLWFAASAVLACGTVFIWPERHCMRVAEAVWAGLGFLTIFYLVYIEIVRLHALCLWCTSLHVIILVMFLITAVRLQEPIAAKDSEEGEEK